MVSERDDRLILSKLLKTISSEPNVDKLKIHLISKPINSKKTSIAIIPILTASCSFIFAVLAYLDIISMTEIGFQGSTMRIVLSIVGAIILSVISVFLMISKRNK